jgi:putative oxidoreductase
LHVDPGGLLQRLFSMFPNEWPGKGLLLLRLVSGSFLIHDGIAGLMGAPQRELVTLQIIAASAGILLLIGLWTPIAGALVAVTELWIALSGTIHLRSSILLAAMGAGIAVLGPGARSIDALLFGRKRLDI